MLLIGLSLSHLMESVKAVDKTIMGGARKTLLLAILLEFICTKSQGRNIHFFDLTTFTSKHLHDVPQVSRLLTHTTYLFHDLYDLPLPRLLTRCHLPYPRRWLVRIWVGLNLIKVEAHHTSGCHINVYFFYIPLHRKCIVTYDVVFLVCCSYSLCSCVQWAVE